MDVLNKLFSKRKKSKENECFRWNGLTFSEDQVRVLVFRESDWHGRKLLFDSSAVEKVPETRPTEAIDVVNNLSKSFNKDKFSTSYEDVSEHCNKRVERFRRKSATCQPNRNNSEISHGYKLSSQKSDTVLLGEIIFGTVALTFHNTMLKIHKLSKKMSDDKKESSKTDGLFTKDNNCLSDSDINKIIISHVFYMPTRRHCNVTKGVTSNNHLEVSKEEDHNCRESNTNISNSGNSMSTFFHQFELFSEHSSLSDASFSSSSSLDCRSQRSVSTSLDHWLYESSNSSAVQSGSFTSALSSSSDSGRTSSGTEDSLLSSHNNCSKRSKFGIAVVMEITGDSEKEVELFLLEYIPLLEMMLWRLRIQFFRGFINLNSFLSIMVQASRESARWLHRLLFTPLSYSRPLWLCDTATVKVDTMNNGRETFWKNLFRTNWNQSINNLAWKTENNVENFIRELCELIEFIDTKNFNFFLSSLITAVLCHHLGWVVPFLDATNKFALCSVVWAQLAEMHGAIGSPPCSASTVVMGLDERVNDIAKLLNILVYFIRYTDIDRRTETISQEDGTKNEKSVVEPLLHLQKQISCSTFPVDSCSIVEEKVSSNRISSASVIDVSSNIDAVNYRCKNDITCDRSSSCAKYENSVVDICNRISSGNNTDEVNYFCSSIDDVSRKTTCDRNSSCVEKEVDVFCGSKYVCDSNSSYLCQYGCDKMYTDVNKNLKKTKSVAHNLSDIRPSDFEGDLTDNPDKKKVETSEEAVIFELGDNEKLVGINLNSREHDKVPEGESKSNNNNKNDFRRSQSVPPEDVVHKRCKKCRTSKMYKFNFNQYPQIATNYIRSKNLEIDNHPMFIEKGIKLNRSLSINFNEFGKDDMAETCTECHCPEMILQTPSNASELEFSSDLQSETRDTTSSKKINIPTVKILNLPETSKVQKKNEQQEKKIKETENDKPKLLKCTEFPLLRSKCVTSSYGYPPAGFAHTLIRANSVNSYYLPGLVLQGTTEPFKVWETALRQELNLSIQYSPLDKPIKESLCIIADVNSWKVRIISTNQSLNGGLTFHPKQNGSTADELIGCLVEPSHLVTDMLDSVLHLWKLNTSPQHCLQHIENQLHEIFVRSVSLSELLLSTDFCDMDSVTATLSLHPNDVPLLLAVASTHTPQVTQKYSVSLQ